MHDERPPTPASPAVSAVKMQLNLSIPQTPKFDPKIHESQDGVTSTAKDRKEDSLLEAIDSRTPAKITCSEPTNSASLTEESLGDLKGKDDSFVEQIMKRSLLRQGSRIEDSVEAIDAFEEEIEKVGELIPAITEEPRLPGRIKKQRNAAKILDLTKEAAKSSAATRKLAPAAGPIAAKTKRPTERAKIAPRKQPSPPKSIDDSKATLEHISEADPANLAKSFTKSSIAGASTTKKLRVSSIHKAPFQPKKSTKPPTRSTFELPGEAIARKLKERREERLKRSEEEPAKKPAFKGRPVRLSQAFTVKPTAASKARMSLANADSGDPKNSSSGTPKSPPFATKGTMSTKEANKRLSVLSITKRPRANEDPNKRLSVLSATKRASLTPADTSARIVRAASFNSTAPNRKSSLMGPPPRPMPIAPAPAELAQQKLRGKEVFNRVRLAQDERDRIKKEKEEAAKKARAEAAERGRIASREWAERQKLKKRTLVVGNLVAETEKS